MYEQVFPKTCKLVTFGSKTSTSIVNNQGSKITPGLFDFSRKTNISSADDHTSLKPPGLVNLGNSCYMNSVMQCLNCLAPLVKFFTKDAHLEEVTSPVSSGGNVANEVGAIFSEMLIGRRSPLSLMALKSRVGELCHQFSGSEQQDSHEFLIYLFTWMHEELRGRGLSALESCGYTLRHLTEELTSEHSVISFLFQRELSGADLASYDLCAVSNHHGTMNGGHYTSYCKPAQGYVWYQCNDKTVTRLLTPVKMSTAYLLFYDSVLADI